MRDAVLTLLNTDAVLTSGPFQLGPGTIHTTFAMDGSRIPGNVSPKGFFIILNWEETVTDGPARKTVLSVWVHKTRESGVNYIPIMTIINRIIFLMESTFHRSGADGGKMSMAFEKGIGSDQTDSAYDTITKYVVFDVLSGEGTTG